MLASDASLEKGSLSSSCKNVIIQHGENMFCTKIVLNVKKNFCTQHVLPSFELGIFMYLTCNAMNNLLSYCGLVDSKIRASDKDLPVNQVTKLTQTDNLHMTAP